MLDERGYLIHNNGRVVDDIGIFGVGGSTPTPMNTPTEYNEEDILGFLNNGYRSIENSRVKILISHSPPKKVRDRTIFGISAGSESVREFIIVNKIDLCLCGHIHEASGIEKLSSCTVANPGSFKKGKYMTVEVGDEIICKKGKIK